MKTTIRRADFALLILKVAALLSAFEAIAIGPVPIEWLALLAPILAGLLSRTPFRGVPLSLIILVVLAVFAQTVSLICIEPSGCDTIKMPPLSTTPYPLFVALRFLPFLMLVSVLAMVAKLKHQQGDLSDYIVRLGSWISAIALYVYFAQVFGLPDIPRTRLGTDGMEVTSVAFSYSFYRALGTFREPSQMAVWLILPFFLSFKSMNWRTHLMASVILLSGSMTAFVAIVGGAALAAFLLSFKSVKRKAWLLRLPLIIAVVTLMSIVPFMLIVRDNGDYSGLWNVVSGRLMPVMTGGIVESNRGFVFEFASELGIPLIGYGLGNINLILTDWMGGQAVAGILSLYLNILLAVGIVGAVLLALFLAGPFTFSISSVDSKKAFAIYAAYFSWLVVFIIHSAEFPLMFALTYGLVMGLKQNPGKKAS